MEPTSENSELLNLSMRLVTTPEITIIKEAGNPQRVPAAGTAAANGFVLNLDTVLPYDALSRLLNTFLHGKRFILSEGFINQHVAVKSCNVYGGLNDRLVIEVQFFGSFDGTVYLTGKPFYDPAFQVVTLQNFRYELKTNNFLLKSAKWLFDKTILAEIKKHTVLELASFFKKLTVNVHDLLNKEWTKGIHASGALTTISITGVYAQPQQLLIGCQCSGSLQLTIQASAFPF